MSVRRPVRMEQFSSRWTNFHEIWNWGILFRKSVEKICASLKSDNIAYFNEHRRTVVIISRWGIEDFFGRENMCHVKIWQYRLFSWTSTYSCDNISLNSYSNEKRFGQKWCRKSTTHLLCLVFPLPPANGAVFVIMCRNVVEPERTLMTNNNTQEGSDLHAV
jgi:hypothetical protein